MSKMTKALTIKYLNDLATVREVLQSTQDEIHVTIDEALKNCPDLLEKRNELENQKKVLTEKIAALTTGINTFVLEKEDAVKADFLQAVYSKGKTTWDTKKLEGYSLAHPEINELKKVGNPSVSIREVKEKK